MDYFTIQKEVIKILSPNIEIAGINRDKITDEFDLISSGVIDSIGLLQLLTELEDFVGIELEFDELEADEVSEIGAICRFVSQQAAKQ